MTGRGIASVVAAIMLMTVPVQARKKIWFEKGEPIVVEPTVAYIAVRTLVTPEKGQVSLVLVRLLDDAEYAAVAAKRRVNGRYDVSSNVVVSSTDGAYARDDGQSLFVFKAQPGRYVLAGLAGVNRHNGPMISCLCMGTVAFDAKAGVVTNMGTLLAARDTEPTDIPELKNLVRGENLGIQPWPVVAGLRQPTKSLPLPALLANLPTVAADYRAYGKFANVLGGSVERLAPVEDVLDYADGRVVDLKETTTPVAR